MPISPPHGGASSDHASFIGHANGNGRAGHAVMDGVRRAALGAALTIGRRIGGRTCDCSSSLSLRLRRPAGGRSEDGLEREEIGNSETA